LQWIFSHASVMEGEHSHHGDCSTKRCRELPCSAECVNPMGSHHAGRVPPRAGRQSGAASDTTSRTWTHDRQGRRGNCASGTGHHRVHAVARRTMAYGTAATAGTTPVGSTRDLHARPVKHCTDRTRCAVHGATMEGSHSHSGRQSRRREERARASEEHRQNKRGSGSPPQARGRRSGRHWSHQQPRRRQVHGWWRGLQRHRGAEHATWTLTCGRRSDHC
jgi:hypothetical protein